jgi:hypothetical protein
MLRRSSTIWLPRIALTLLTLLMSHDVIMEMDPHDVEHTATHGDHAPTHNVPHPDAGSHVETATCMSLEAARTSESGRVDADLPSNVITDSRCQEAESEPIVIDRDEPGLSPGQRRAMLQVYLN